MPAPPCASGTIRPASPSCSASSVQTSGSKPRSLAICARTAASSQCSARNARIVARSSSCSSVNAKSVAIDDLRPFYFARLRFAARALRALASGARHVLPGHVLVDARLAGQTQHAFAEDVAHDLRGAPLDRVRARAQEPVLRLILEAPGALGRLTQLVARLEREAARAEHVDRGLPEVFIDLRHRELRDRSLRAGVAGLLRRACALRGEAAQLDVDVAARDAIAQQGFLIRAERIPLAPVPQLDQLAGGAAALAPRHAAADRDAL